MIGSAAAQVDLRGDLLPRHRGALRALQLVGSHLNPEQWCLVGGMMVLVAARAAGSQLPQRSAVTKDADVVVDVCADRRLLANVAYQLRQVGYDTLESPEDNPDLARCTFTSGLAQIDVLCPDDADDAALDAAAGVRSLAIPGGRRALQTAQPVRVTYDDDAFDVDLRVPLLPWALIVKAHAAVDQRTTDQDRHIRDLAELSAILDDPMADARILPADDIAVLAAAADRVEARADIAFQGLEPLSRARARAALRILTGR